MSRDGYVALPRGAMGFLRFVIVMILDHTHLLFLLFEAIQRNIKQQVQRKFSKELAIFQYLNKVGNSPSTD